MSLLTLYIGWLVGAANIVTASGVHAVPLPEGTRCTLDWVDPHNDSRQVWACKSPDASLVCVPVNAYLWVIPLRPWAGVDGYRPQCPAPEAT